MLTACYAVTTDKPPPEARLEGGGAVFVGVGPPILDVILQKVAKNEYNHLVSRTTWAKRFNKYVDEQYDKIMARRDEILQKAKKQGTRSDTKFGSSDGDRERGDTRGTSSSATTRRSDIRSTTFGSNKSDMVLTLENDW